ncbi:hypothetical protein AGMMS50268_09150 [Spirochaetia bacterium]|nr:hypothetical protein AGMMS50268_09150 [Spirochaetia bacterium]
MKAARHQAGSPCPVYAGGIKYRSIFEASIETGISYPGIFKRLKASQGAPVLIRGLAVVEEAWVDSVIGNYSDEAIRGYLGDQGER